VKLLLVGSGRAARALGPRWAGAGHEVMTWSRQDGPLNAAPAAEVGILAVPDALIGEVATALRERAAASSEIWLHLSGVHPASVLRGDTAQAPRAVGCLHPLVALAPGADPTGACAGIEGEPAACLIAAQLARDAGLVPHAIPAERALYHAAAVTVAGHATALFAQAMSLFEAAGFTPEAARAALQPLFLSAAANLARGAPAAVITGPASRGDVATVARHLAALEAHGDEAVLDVYRRLGQEALHLSQARLDPVVAIQLEALLQAR